MTNVFKRLLRQGISKDQCKDAGMAFSLIFILLKFVLSYDLFLVLGTAALVITMTVPSVLKSLAVIWFGLAELLGAVVSKIILSLAFFVVVTPVGTVRRLLRKDSLRLCEFKKGKGSVMDERNKVYKPEDIVKPF